MSTVHSDYGRADTTGRSGTTVGLVRRISWGAIFAGVSVAMVTQLVLNLLGLGVGASTLEPTAADAVSGQALGIGTIIWLVLTTIVALFAGGWVAGRLAGFPSRLESGLHGLVTFAVVTLLTFYMLTTTLGALLSTTTNALGQALAGAGSGAAAAVEVFAMPAGGQGQGDQPGFMQQQARQWLERQGIQTTNPEATTRITQAAIDYVTALAAQGEQQAQQQRQALVSAVSQNTTLSEQEVNQKVDQLRQQYQDVRGQAQQAWQGVKQQTAEAADTAADSVAGASFGTFLALLLGAGAAMFGAYLATPNGVMLARPEAVVHPTRGRDEE